MGPGRGSDSLFLTQLAQRGGRERAVVFGSQVVTGGAVEEVRWCLCPRDPSCRDLSSVQPEAEWRVPDPGGAGGPAPHGLSGAVANGALKLPAPGSGPGQQGRLPDQREGGGAGRRAGGVAGRRDSDPRKAFLPQEAELGN